MKTHYAGEQILYAQELNASRTMARQYMEQAAAASAATSSTVVATDPALVALNKKLALDLAAAQNARTLEHQRSEVYKDEYYQERSTAHESNQQWLTAVQCEEYWENSANEYYDRAEALTSELAAAAAAPPRATSGYSGGLGASASGGPPLVGAGGGGGPPDPSGGGSSTGTGLGGGGGPKPPPPGRRSWFATRAIWSPR